MLLGYQTSISVNINAHTAKAVVYLYLNFNQKGMQQQQVTYYHNELRNRDKENGQRSLSVRGVDNSGGVLVQSREWRKY